MSNIFIGIDPSVNSTGMTILNDEGYCRFFIIKGGKLSKKEINASKEYSDIFEYILYDKQEVKDSKNSYERELFKTHNLIEISNCILNEINVKVSEFVNVNSITICMEGISYGSIKSSAVMDLAGLNYLLRDRLKNVSSKLYICPPGEIKKYYAGSGNANKELMISTFKGAFPDFDLPKTDDVVDSYAMASFARHMFECSN